MQMFNPSHPGEILREDVLPAMNLTITDAAIEIGVSRVALSRILNAKANISITMAIKLEKWRQCKKLVAYAIRL